jgi:hypothetical protein
MSLGFLLFLCRARFFGGTFNGLVAVVVVVVVVEVSTGWGSGIVEEGGPSRSLESSISDYMLSVSSY